MNLPFGLKCPLGTVIKVVKAYTRFGGVSLKVNQEKIARRTLCKVSTAWDTVIAKAPTAFEIKRDCSPNFQCSHFEVIKIERQAIGRVGSVAV